MTNAVFATKSLSAGDCDLPEVGYRFSSANLALVRQTVGDWIVYSRPCLEDDVCAGRASGGVYFATARVHRVEAGSAATSRGYAFVSDYLEFPRPVPLAVAGRYCESALAKRGGMTNKGALARAVRLVPAAEFAAILQLGLTSRLGAGAHPGEALRVSERSMHYRAVRRTDLVARPARDAVFARTIRDLYHSACAFTGLRIVDGGGRCEIEAAHIRPVAADGPDSTRNGLALSRTVHWLFDRGIVSVDNDGHILAAVDLLPEALGRLFHPNHKITWPRDLRRRPHPVYLDYHRTVICKGKTLRRLE